MTDARGIKNAPGAADLGRRFELLGELGSGGMGTVHRARERASGRVVALKQLHVPSSERNRARFEAMFEREYHTLARLRHPHAVEVYAFGRSERGPYYTMELLAGSDVHALAPLSPAEVCRHLRDITSLLALLHTHRLVHRDISPRNVRLTEDGRAKLIDFGALHAFGVASEIVGTAPCVAPELLGRMPLDPRSDLFSLGALGYWALTRRHAYPARRIEELPELWRRAPIAPSQLVPGIPPALDALVLSLLSIDPLSRPSGSAEVIERLTAIGGLPPEEHERTERSYLGSSRMVGRTLELHWLDKHLDAALQGHGLPIVLEGVPGIGKTRLMHEFGLHAQLRGAHVLRADAGARVGAYGVATQLALHLLALCPEAATLAGPHAQVLSHLDERLCEQLGMRDAPELPALANERRARVQQALHAWFVATAERWPLAMLIDDLHAADDNSAAFLAALAQHARRLPLLLLCTQQSGTTPVADVPVRALRKGSAYLKLGPLDAQATHEFVTSIFGDAEHKGPLSTLLLQRSGGNPQLCVEYTERLVRDKIARYAGGAWLLPPDLSGEVLPEQADALLRARLEALPSAARRLGEALCVHRKPLSLELCLALADEGDSAATHAALDQLTAEQIVIQNETGYRFAHEALRELLLKQLSPESRRAMHLRAGHTLLARAGDDLWLQVSAARHLLAGGDEARALALISTVGRAFLRVRVADYDPEEIVHTLQAALLVCERRRLPPEFSADLMLAMMPLAFSTSSEWRLIRRYGERAVALGLEVTGLARAARLRPILGARAALAVALGSASLRINRLRKRGLQYDLREAIELLCGCLPAVHGTLGLCQDAEACRRVVAKLEPLTFFGKQHPVMLSYDYCADQLAWLECRMTEYLDGLKRAKAQARSPRLVEALGQDSADFFYGVIVWMRSLVESSGFGNAAVQGARELEQQGSRWFDNAADQIRMVYHATRGEAQLAASYRERIELFAMQGGTTWQLQLVSAPIAISLDGRTGDAIAARRNADQIARLATGIASLRPHAIATEATALALRGQFDAAIACFERALPQLPPRGSLFWLSLRAGYAQTLNWAGQHVRARELMGSALAELEAGCDAFTGDRLWAECQLALADAGLGDFALATTRLDALLAQHAAEDHPLFVGGLRQARAEVALRMRDRERFEAHFAELDRLYRSTHNPALIAQCERLAERAIAAGLREAPAHLTSGVSQLSAAGTTSEHETVGELGIAADPYQYALALLIERTRARRGYVYLLERGTLQLMAASGTDAPPHEAEVALLQRIEREEFEARDDVRPEETTSMQAAPELDAITRRMPRGVEPADSTAHTRMLDLPAGEGAQDTRRIYLLRRPSGARGGPIGGVILEPGKRGYRAPGEAWLDAIAAALVARNLPASGGLRATLPAPSGAGRAASFSLHGAKPE